MVKFAIKFILLMCVLTRPVQISGQDLVISSNIVPGTSTVTTAQLVARIEELERIIALLTGEIAFSFRLSFCMLMIKHNFRTKISYYSSF